MRSEWHIAEETIGGYACIKHRITKELCLYGHNGEIWQFSENNEPRYSCAVWGQQSANKMGTLLQAGLHYTKHKGEEIVFRFDSKHLSEVVKILRVPKTRPVQIRLLEKRRLAV